MDSFCGVLRVFLRDLFLENLVPQDLSQSTRNFLWGKTTPIQRAFRPHCLAAFFKAS
jgi:hypothetical protein